MADKLHLNCKHSWKSYFDYDECEICHCTRRLLGGVYKYWSVDGQRFTNRDVEDGDEAVAYVEEELKKLKKR